MIFVKKPTILRKRYIPFETVDISGDELVFRDAELIITKWNVLNPRPDISKGTSYTFLKEGFKISRFYDGKGNFSYWYCDIIEVNYFEDEDKYILTDLLADVKILPDEIMQILDLDELADALDKNLITKEQTIDALRKLHKIVDMCNNKSFPPEICKKNEFWNE